VLSIRQPIFHFTVVPNGTYKQNLIVKKKQDTEGS
jgi:hypothetical protein